MRIVVKESIPVRVGQGKASWSKKRALWRDSFLVPFEGFRLWGFRGLRERSRITGNPKGAWQMLGNLRGNLVPMCSIFQAW